MNDVLVHLGIAHWKPMLRYLLMPPTPLLLLALLGLLMVGRRRRLGQALIGLGLAGLWWVCTPAGALLMTRHLTQAPPPLTAAQVQALRGAPDTVVLVLGGGRRLDVPEVHGPDLHPITLARLRYGVWLARQTGLPLAFSGGVGYVGAPGASEAEIAAQVAQREFGLPLRWAEGRSRDTQENARYSIALLQPAGIRRIVLVTDGSHQRRAVAAFRKAVSALPQSQGTAIDVQPAAMAVWPTGPLSADDWLPHSDALKISWLAWYEWLGWLAGA